MRLFEKSVIYYLLWWIVAFFSIIGPNKDGFRLIPPIMKHFTVNSAFEVITLALLIVYVLIVV